MAKKLVVVESPTKSKTLMKFLGPDYEVLASGGHIFDLPERELAVDIEHDFTPKYTVIKGKDKLLKQLRDAAKKASQVYLAPDPDREGEAIAWHLANNLERDGKKCYRIKFNEITERAVKASIGDAGPLDLNLVNAQQARRVLDRLVGYLVSPILWETMNIPTLSAGRVQTVALRMICEREQAIRDFKPEEYWSLWLQLKTPRNEPFNAKFIGLDGKKTELHSKAEVDEVLKKLDGQPAAIKSINRSSKKRNPMPPFITSTLQMEASRRLGMPAARTMQLAQGLYEGVDVDGTGPIGLITYMRTDSVRVSTDAQDVTQQFVTSNYGKEYAPAKPPIYSTKKGAQDAHEAIRPTDPTLTPERLKKVLPPDQMSIYKLIWERFISSQMMPATYATMQVDINCGPGLFRATGQRLTFDGFLKVYQDIKTKEEEEEVEEENGTGTLPQIEDKDALKISKFDPKQHFTKPPAYFTEGTLVKELEAKGIGRPSTYAQILQTLQKRKYIKRERGKLHPTDIGDAVTKLLVANFDEFFNESFTAGMEAGLDQIESGAVQWVDEVRKFYVPFAETLAMVRQKKGEIKRSLVTATEQVCEKCGGAMVIRWGRNGQFLACSNFPTCRNAKPLHEEAQPPTEEKCEKCGKPMLVKSGRYGRFLACSGYPDCRSVRPFATSIACPEEGCTGKLVERRSGKGKHFYGCSRYPECKFVTWSVPIAEVCTACKHPFLVERKLKNGSKRICPRCKAEYASDGAKDAG